ncbi:MAG: hypothetical protein PHY47_12970 [Lachnospiraceae bacterium]|nr:hypothetical protein [Lachnospiraceae bacterium]
MIKNDFIGTLKRYLLYVLSIVMIASIFQVVIPTPVISKVLGEQNGLLAPLIATLVAAIFEGPTIVAFVIAAGLLNSATSVSAAVAFISSFSMIGIYSIPLEQSELGKKLPIIRFGLTFVGCIIIGFCCQVLYKLF